MKRNLGEDGPKAKPVELIMEVVEDEQPLTQPAASQLEASLSQPPNTTTCSSCSRHDMRLKKLEAIRLRESRDAARSKERSDIMVAELLAQLKLSQAELIELRKEVTGMRKLRADILIALAKYN